MICLLLRLLYHKHVQFFSAFVLRSCKNNANRVELSTAPCLLDFCYLSTVSDRLARTLKALFCKKSIVFFSEKLLPVDLLLKLSPSMLLQTPLKSKNALFWSRSSMEFTNSRCQLQYRIHGWVKSKELALSLREVVLDFPFFSVGYMFSKCLAIFIDQLNIVYF
jgi:hypothetical protein